MDAMEDTELALSRIQSVGVRKMPWNSGGLIERFRCQASRIENGRCRWICRRIVMFLKGKITDKSIQFSHTYKEWETRMNGRENDCDLMLLKDKKAHY